MTLLCVKIIVEKVTTEDDMPTTHIHVVVYFRETHHHKPEKSSFSGHQALQLL